MDWDIRGSRRRNDGDDHGKERDRNTAQSTDQCTGCAAGHEERTLSFASKAMHDEANKQVDEWDEVNQQRHVDQGEKGSLHSRSLADHREKEKEYRNWRLNQDRHVRRVPTRMDPAKRRWKITIQTNDKRDTG